jgi:hypothetical protein
MACNTGRSLPEVCSTQRTEEVLSRACDTPLDKRLHNKSLRKHILIPPIFLLSNPFGTWHPSRRSTQNLGQSTPAGTNETTTTLPHTHL